MSTVLNEEVLKRVKIRTKSKKQSNETDNRYFTAIQEVEEFATAHNVSLQWLKCTAKSLKMIRTMGHRSKREDRIGFGLSTTVSRALPACPRTLFKFGLISSTGLFNASECDIIVSSVQFVFP